MWSCGTSFPNELIQTQIRDSFTEHRVQGRKDKGEKEASVAAGLHGLHLPCCFGHANVPQ